jgi:hypothetical protein
MKLVALGLVDQCEKEHPEANAQRPSLNSPAHTLDDLEAPE